MVLRPGPWGRPRRLGTVRPSPLVSSGTPLEPALTYASSVSHVPLSAFSGRLRIRSMMPRII